MGRMGRMGIMGRMGRMGIMGRIGAMRDCGVLADGTGRRLQMRLRKYLNKRIM